MKRTILLGLVFMSGMAVGTGCSTTPPARDYHEYSAIRAGQPGAGDAVGMSMYNDYGKAANGRPIRTRPTGMASTGQE
jgi:hypothetical protein